MLRQTLQDLRFAFHSLRKAPLLSLATVLTLATGFEELAAFLPFKTDFIVTGGGEAEMMPSGVASVNLFAALGVRPVLGQRPSDPRRGWRGPLKW